MAFIRSKRIKGHEYFYLVENFRQGSRIVQKVIKYLGKSGVFDKTVNYLTSRDINEIHEKAIKKFGGERGILNPGTIDFAADYLFDKRISEKNPLERNAARAGKLLHFIISTHPFVDGNKRTGFESARLLLILNGFDVKYSLDEAARFCFDVGSGKVNEKEVMEWLLKRMKLLKGRA